MGGQRRSLFVGVAHSRRICRRRGRRWLRLLKAQQKQIEGAALTVRGWLSRRGRQMSGVFSMLGQSRSVKGGQYAEAFPEESIDSAKSEMLSCPPNAPGRFVLYGYLPLFCNQKAARLSNRVVRLFEFSSSSQIFPTQLGNSTGRRYFASRRNGDREDRQTRAGRDGVQPPRRDRTHPLNYQAAPVMGLKAEGYQAHTLNTGERIDEMELSLRRGP